ncbi:hypothetical protein GND98_012325 [Clostridium butyricum]|uniref:Uncharacterized protein n=1 Tax=Clostridium butyricum TaxID=1492 RepID=A0A6L9EQ58_CLOBU|nr:hypothetical protein [Clostridium butyricum]
MQVGDKIKLKVKQMAKLNRPAFVEHKGYISNISSNVIVVMYTDSYNKDLYRVSFNIADIIEGKAIIEIKEKGIWRLINQFDFMEMRENAEAQENTIQGNRGQAI